MCVHQVDETDLMRTVQDTNYYKFNTVCLMIHYYLMRYLDIFCLTSVTVNKHNNHHLYVHHVLVNPRRTCTTTLVIARVRYV